MVDDDFNLIQALRQVTSTLDAAGIPYALCGGLAVTIHGAVRSTKDIDLLVQPRDVEPIVELVRDQGWKFRAHPMIFDAGEPHARHLQRVSRIDDGRIMMLDLIEVTPFFGPIWEGRIAVVFEDHTLHVVSLEGLAAMKRLAGRPQDLADLEKLGVG